MNPTSTSESPERIGNSEALEGGGITAGGAERREEHFRQIGERFGGAAVGLAGRKPAAVHAQEHLVDKTSLERAENVRDGDGIRLAANVIELQPGPERESDCVGRWRYFQGLAGRLHYNPRS